MLITPNYSTFPKSLYLLCIFLFSISIIGLYMYKYVTKHFDIEGIVDHHFKNLL